MNALAGNETHESNLNASQANALLSGHPRQANEGREGPIVRPTLTVRHV